MSPSLSPSHSSSPSPQPKTPSSPPTATLLQPLPLNLSPPKKPHPIPWTHEETLHLIRAYQEKWYSLQRGQLKSSQWEEVAVTIAARCGLDDPAKSATQCRHKIEKLRKRFRAEKLKPFPNPWVYFPLMENLERGPLPISAIPSVAVVESDEDDFGQDLGGGYSRKFDGFLEMGEFRNGYQRDGGNLRKRKVWEEEEEEEEEEEKRGREGEKDIMGELAAQMRGFAERFVRVERKKMEMMRESERYRMEMENKKMEMILVSQQRTVDMVSKVFGLPQKKI